jgi:hypothetical protein
MWRPKRHLPGRKLTMTDTRTDAIVVTCPQCEEPTPRRLDELRRGVLLTCPHCRKVTRIGRESFADIAGIFETLAKAHP